MIATLLFIIAILALALSAFCSGAESGFLSVNRGRIIHLVNAGSKSAKIISIAISNMSRTVTSILIGNNIANVVYSSASAALATIFFADRTSGNAVWSFIAASLILYTGEFLPKLFFSSRPLSRLLAIAKFYRIFSIVLSPLTKVAMWVTGFVMKKGDPKDQVTMNDLVRILQDRKDGVRLTDFESVLISRILVMRRKGEFITVDSLLRALDD